MPELPDLEIFSRNLAHHLKGKQLREIVVKNPKKLNVSVKELNLSIENQKLINVSRSGKELYFEFENKAVLSFHLMLKGELHFLKKEESPKHSILEMHFKDGSHLCLTDFRGMAKATLNPAEDPVPDALAKEIDEHFFKNIFASKKAAVKNVLLDQHVIRGIGNAYADEILWEAGISPFSSAYKIPVEKLKDLAKAVRHVLKNAVEQISKTHPAIISGEVRDFLKIHSPKKTHSPSGVPIIIVKTGARKTYYTEEQEIYN
ncbi:formamidopyrimidine-DNA glycosylase [Pedobacter cryoconitis]|uniref:Fpg/Nei family DNA glycosylase n=1 Tax=Pedobacter cryoconitis TaxID=188932 RepID=UPI00160C627B|nr:DNA-formamidopyrimidine glycosylase family protein [Pedobacter cryoconitis]MBB6272105.1 formamidopyrimidine-DNA glycosylase [Pedobacter cryoconitis]